MPKIPPIHLTQELYNSIDAFMIANGYNSIYAASRALLLKGLGREEYDRKAHRRTPTNSNPKNQSQNTIRPNQRANSGTQPETDNDNTDLADLDRELEEEPT